MLEAFVHKGKSAARSQTRARILLKAAADVQDKNIIQALEVSIRGVRSYASMKATSNSLSTCANQYLSNRAPRIDMTEYQRKGVCDLMMICEPKQGFRQVDIVDRRTKIEFVHSMKPIADLYPDALVIRVVLDNLNTHKVASLHEAFPAEQARNLVRRLEFHTTPRHGSLLNIAEIERAVLSNRCLSQRIPDQDLLRREVEANVRERDVKAIPINWRFTTQEARQSELTCDD